VSSIAETLAQAKEYHGCGQLRHAEQFCRKVLQTDSANVDALYLLGTACHDLGNPDEAVANLQRAVQLNPDHADAHHRLGVIWSQQGELDAAIASFQQARRLKPGSPEVSQDLRNALAARDNRRGMAVAEAGNLDEAEACYRRALEQRPAYVAAQGNLGNLLKGRGLLDEAAVCYRRVLELKPESAEAHYNLALISEEQAKLDEAVAEYRRTLQLKPGLAEAHHRLGCLLADRGEVEGARDCFQRALALDAGLFETYDRLGALLASRDNFENAVVCFQRALALKPDFAEAHANLGASLSEQGKYEEAVVCLRRSLEIKPDFAQAYNLLGTALLMQRKYEDAVISLRRALALKSEFSEAHTHLGAALSMQGQLDEAVTCFQRALDLKPDCSEAHNNLGAVLERQERLDDAVSSFNRALELRPDFVEARIGRALALLLMGRFKEGWPEYEWRLKRKGVEEPVLQKPRWTGTTVPGARILLRCEQGFGDTLQFIRYAELVKQRCGAVIVECQPALARLLASCPGVDGVFAAGTPRPEFDFHIPLLSLPGVFGTSLENIPAKVPYLWPCADMVEKRKAELGEAGTFKIGIAWQGGNDYEKDRCRSIPLAQFAGIARMHGVRTYSLQMGAGREQLTDLGGQSPIVDLGDRLGDFHDTAAFVRNFDLVITCDSAPAHLAGSLGVPVWVALSFGPDWRWLLDRTDSPWYPTARLFRQTRPGDWDRVFRTMESELAKLVKNR
jgi:tetratricopeptide (TPR) repeat protein